MALPLMLVLLAVAEEAELDPRELATLHLHQRALDTLLLLQLPTLLLL
jgi:hypothetical protein